MMRFPVLVGAAALGLVAAPALAADLPPMAQPLPTPPAVQAAPANDWSGFFLGALGGYGWGTASTDAVGDVDADGFDVGGYAGANYQWGNYVIGAEGDILYPWREEDQGGLNVKQGVNGSIRGRVGIALDRFLVYGTGGAAATSLKLEGNGDSDDNTLWGWTAGAGVEGMLTNNITARVEYRYTDYQDKTFDLGGVPVDSDFSTSTIHGGIGVKF
jgi:outer membrane immunogenic protein